MLTMTVLFTANPGCEPHQSFCPEQPFVFSEVYDFFSNLNFCFFSINILVIPSCSRSLPMKLIHNYAFVLCLRGEPSFSAFAPTHTSQALWQTCSLLSPSLTVHWFYPTHLPFWILLHCLTSLPRD